MNIRAVVCDVGGVLLRTEDPAPRRRWEERLHLAPGSLEEVVFDNPVALRATVGEASNAQVWSEVGRMLSLSAADLDCLRMDFFAGDRWDAEFLALLRDCRPRLRTGVLSNAWPDARSDQAAWINSGVFDFILYSAELHCRKPWPEFFQMAVDNAGVSPEEVLFIDDFRDNVEAAARFGLQSLLFTDVEGVRSILSGHAEAKLSDK
jgi:glucose-1-phosphatase